MVSQVQNMGYTGTLAVIGCVQADVVMSPVNELPSAGGTLLADSMVVRLGGAGANSALAAIEAGIHTRLIGCVGDDQMGQWMRDQLTPLGLADELVVVSGESTGLTVALESPTRDRCFLTYLGVNAGWEPSTVPDSALSCKNVLFCDYFVAPGMRGESGVRLLSRARENGARTFFDTAWDADGFPAHTRAEVHDLLPYVDVFLPNEIEACAIADLPGDPVGAARALQRISGGWVVVKLGPSGCFAAGPDGAELRAVAPAVKAIDTTGAGDCFNAGLVRALDESAGWQEALMSATQFASTIVSRPSDQRYHRPPPASLVAASPAEID